MGFTTAQAVINEAVSNGKTWETFFYKTGPVEAAGAAGRWYDISSWSGNPRANVYPGGLGANDMSYSPTNGAFASGPAMSPRIGGATFYVNGSLQIVHTSNGFLAGGFQAGQSVVITGFTNPGNNDTKKISTVTRGVLILTDTTGMVAEPNSGQNITILSQSSQTKFLTKAMIWAPTTGNMVNASFLLCDYLMFYDFFDMTITDFQPTASTMPLPRYTNGNGVQMFLVSTNDVGSSVVQGQVTYTNSLGVQGQISQMITFNPPTATNVSSLPYAGVTSYAANIGSISNGPWIPLAAGDVGVQSVQGIQLNGSCGSGYCALVLAYPLFHIQNRSIALPTEQDTFTEVPVCPKIYDNAYLNWLCFSGAAIATGSVFSGMLEFAWGDQ